MFSVRIHSLDRPSTAVVPLRPPSADLSESVDGPSPEAAGTSRNPKPNPGIQHLRGIVHLYRRLSSPPSASSSSSSSTNPQASSESLLPAVRGTLLLVLAVPCRLSLEDLLRLCGSYIESSSVIRVIRDDAIEDRYSVLVEFDDQNSADGFCLEANGCRFSTEGEVCHILFIDSVEFTESTQVAGTPPNGSTELPTCPVCIERLDEDTSGIIATTCDHSFRCSCISKWINSSCSVCHFCRNHSEKPTCSLCGTPENLWICMICGFIGCGRYREGHAIRHWKDTQHCYFLDLDTQRVWDYVGDSYVHRINQSKSDEKLLKLKSNSRFTGEKCSDDDGISRALLSSIDHMIYDKVMKEQNLLLKKWMEVVARCRDDRTIRRWKDQHCYSRYRDTQWVMNFGGDYVHRLNQSKSDEKLPKLKSNSRFTGEKCSDDVGISGAILSKVDVERIYRVLKSNSRFTGEKCSDDVGISGAILNKVDVIVDEYKHLIASQLESQRRYYDSMIQKEKENRETNISEAVERAVSLKRKDIELKIENAIREKQAVADINDKLVKEQNLWHQKIKELEAREKATLKLKDEKIRDLEEEIRDLTIHIEAQKTLHAAEAGDIQGGTLLPVPLPQATSAKAKKSSKTNRRKK